MEPRLWRQITLRVPLALMDAAADFLTTVLGRGVCLREQGEQAFIDAWIAPEDGDDSVAAVRRYVQDLLVQEDDPGENLLQVRDVPEEDWMTVFRSQHTAVPISPRLVVRPAWCDPIGPDDLVLDPGMAFGTGSHFTTKMCLQILDGLPAGTPKDRLLDLGTGSGILALAGASLGFAAILAVDIDPVAVRVATDNVHRNGAADIVRVEEGGIERAEGLYEVITANLSGSLLIQLAEDLSAHLAPRGYLIASGMVTEEKDRIFAALAIQGLSVVQAFEEDVWVAALLRKGSEV